MTVSSPNPKQQAPKFERSVSLLSWAYNEEKSIAGFLARAIETMERAVADFEIVVVDDGSSDATPAILAEHARRDPRIRVVTHERNLNVGLACRTAIASARKEVLFWQTVDWAYDLTDLRSYLELLHQYDAVQGVRWAGTSKRPDGPILRLLHIAEGRSDNIRKAMVSWVNYWVIRLLFGVPFYDFQNVTLYPTALIQSAPLRGRTSFVNPECLLRSVALGANFVQVPIEFIPREQGEAKGTRLSSILRSMGDILINWLSWGWRYRLTVAAGSHKQIEDLYKTGEIDRGKVRPDRPICPAGRMTAR